MISADIKIADVKQKEMKEIKVVSCTFLQEVGTFKEIQKQAFHLILGLHLIQLYIVGSYCYSGGFLLNRQNLLVVMKVNAIKIIKRYLVQANIW